MARKWKITAALLLAAAMLAGCAAGKLTDNGKEETAGGEKEPPAQAASVDGQKMGNAGAGDENKAEGQVDYRPPAEYDPQPQQPDDPALPGGNPETLPSLPDRTLPDGETLGPPVLPSSGSGLSFGGQILRVADLDPQVTYVNWSEAGGAAFQSWAMEYTEGRIVLLEDRRTLDDFVADMDRYFSLGGEGKGFRGLADSWDKAFFGEKVLLIVYFPSGSGSNRFALKFAEIWESKLSLQVECRIPEIGTCDMAGWFLSIEIPRTVWQKVSCVGMDVNAVMADGRK